MSPRTKREFNSSHKANDLMWWSYICHLFRCLLAHNIAVTCMMIFITVLRTLMDYRTDKVFLGLRRVRSISAPFVNKSEQHLQWKAGVSFPSPFCAALCIQVICSLLTSLIETWDSSRYRLKQMFAAWIFSVVSSFFPCILKGIKYWK